MLKLPIYDFVAYHYVQSCGHIQEQEMKERRVSSVGDMDLKNITFY